MPARGPPHLLMVALAVVLAAFAPPASAQPAPAPPSSCAMVAEYLADSIDAVPGLAEGVLGTNMMKQLISSLLDAPVLGCGGDGAATAAPAQSVLGTLAEPVAQCQADVAGNVSGAFGTCSDQLQSAFSDAAVYTILAVEAGAESLSLTADIEIENVVDSRLEFELGSSGATATVESSVKTNTGYLGEDESGETRYQSSTAAGYKGGMSSSRVFGEVGVSATAHDDLEAASATADASAGASFSATIGNPSNMRFIATANVQASAAVSNRAPQASPAALNALAVFGGLWRPFRQQNAQSEGGDVARVSAYANAKFVATPGGFCAHANSGFEASFSFAEFAALICNSGETLAAALGVENSDLPAFGNCPTPPESSTGARVRGSVSVYASLTSSGAFSAAASCEVALQFNFAEFLDMICVFADWLGPMAQGSYSDGCPWWLDPDLLPSFDVAVQAGITIAGSTVNVHLGSSELRLPLTIPWMDCGCNRGGWVWTFPALPPWGIVPLRDLCMANVFCGADWGKLYYHCCPMVPTDVAEARMAVDFDMVADPNDGVLRLTASYSMTYGMLGPVLEICRMLFPGSFCQPKTICGRFTLDAGEINPSVQIVFNTGMPSTYRFWLGLIPIDIPIPCEIQRPCFTYYLNSGQIVSCSSSCSRAEMRSTCPAEYQYEPPQCSDAGLPIEAIGARHNIAAGRRATMSSTMHGGEAWKAVDGNAATEYSAGSCTHSDASYARRMVAITHLATTTDCTGSDPSPPPPSSSSPSPSPSVRYDRYFPSNECIASSGSEDDDEDDEDDDDGAAYMKFVCGENGVAMFAFYSDASCTVQDPNWSTSVTPDGCITVNDRPDMGSFLTVSCGDFMSCTINDEAEWYLQYTDCSTAPTPIPQWWQVDLEDDYAVDNVHIYHRSEEEACGSACASAISLVGAKVFLSTTPDYSSGYECFTSSVNGAPEAGSCDGRRVEVCDDAICEPRCEVPEVEHGTFTREGWTGAQDGEILPQMRQSIRATRVAAGGCSNNAVVLEAVASVTDCAKLIWMDRRCGALFEYDSASKLCSCLQSGAVCSTIAVEDHTGAFTSRYNASARGTPVIQCDEGYTLNTNFTATCTCDNPNDLCREVEGNVTVSSWGVFLPDGSEVNATVPVDQGSVLPSSGLFCPGVAVETGDTAPSAGIFMPGCYELQCGLSSSCTNEPSYCAGLSELHEVSCCADIAVPGWVRKPGCNVWAERDPSGHQCQHALSHADAVLFCERIGGRLCTRTELEADCTSGTGCEHDNDLQWSSTAGVQQEYHGCFVDSESRDLDGLIVNLDHVETLAQARSECATHCSGYTYFGLQWTSQCSCGNSFGSQGEADSAGCNACGTINGQQCGWKNAVYSVMPTFFPVSEEQASEGVTAPQFGLFIPTRKNCAPISEACTPVVVTEEMDDVDEESSIQSIESYMAGLRQQLAAAEESAEATPGSGARRMVSARSFANSDDCTGEPVLSYLPIDECMPTGTGSDRSSGSHIKYTCNDAGATMYRLYSDAACAILDQSTALIAEIFLPGSCYPDDSSESYMAERCGVSMRCTINEGEDVGFQSKYTNCAVVENANDDASDRHEADDQVLQLTRALAAAEYELAQLRSAADSITTLSQPGIGTSVEVEAVVSQPGIGTSVEVEAVVYTAIELARAASAVQSKLRRARGADVESVKVHSSATFPISLNAIAQGSAARAEFVTGFKAALSAKLGGGGAITADDVVIDAIVTSTSSGRRRRQLQYSSKRAQEERQVVGAGIVDRRRLMEAVDVQYHILTPATVQTEAASLIKTMKASGNAGDLVVAVGGSQYTAPAASMGEPQVTQVVMQPDDVDEDSNDEGDKESAIVIIAAAAGGGVLVLVVIVALLFRGCSRKTVGTTVVVIQQQQPTQVMLQAPNTAQGIPTFQGP